MKNERSVPETQNAPRYAHTCGDYPGWCFMCETDRKAEPAPTPKENPPCAIPVLRADKGSQ